MVKNLFVSTAILILIIGCSISEEVNIENNWADVKAALQSVVGNYFTQAELNAFAAPYDYHFSN